MTDGFGAALRPTAGSIRVGTDLVSVSEVAVSIEQFGDRYLGRVYTVSEIADCTGPQGPSAERLAARFAAKESVIKALGTAEAIDPRDIEIKLGADGAPSVVFGGRLARNAAAISIVDSSVSLSHDNGLASAVFVAVTDPYPSPVPPEESESHV